MTFPPNRRPRLVVAVASTILLAAVLWVGTDQQLNRIDFFNYWFGGVAALHHRTPYLAPDAAAAIGYPGYSYHYPGPAALWLAPFGLLSQRLAYVLWTAFGVGFLAYGITLAGWWRLGILAAAPLWVSVLMGQTGSWTTAAAVLPWLGWVYAAKPSIGLALWLAWPRRAPVVAGAGLVLLSLLWLPEWPQAWWANVGDAPFYLAPIRRPFGWLLLLGWLRWREPGGRLLGALALIPHTTSLYEMVPLLLLAKRPRDLLVLLALGWVAYYLIYTYTTRNPADVVQLLAAQWPYILTLCYLPALGLVLHTKSMQPGPAAEEGDRIKRFILPVLGTFALLVVFIAWQRRTTASPPAVPNQPAATHLLQVLNRDGLSASLDTLERMAAQDSAVLRDGHQLAHALGRQALRSSSGDPSVLAQCRPVFAAGCYHGVVEAYLQSRPIDVAELQRMCGAAGDEQNPAPVYECIHGLGHGMLGALHLDLRRTLRYCADLPEPRFASSCQEGAFMEAISSAVAPMGHRHDGEAHGPHPGANPTLTIDTKDPYAPCSRFDDFPAASCWLFQAAVILRQAGFEPSRAFQICDAAPVRRRDQCYQGLGLQLAGLFQRDDGWILAQCAKGRPDLASSCAAGATIALVEMDWTGARALGFCAAASATWKESCYRMAGARLALVTPQVRRAELCDRIEGRYVQVCRAGAALADRK